MYVIGLIKLGREIETIRARFPSVQELHCALSHIVICLYVSRLWVIFTLSAHITREVSTIIEKVSIVIKAFRIELISFGKKQEYSFLEKFYFSLFK